MVGDCRPSADQRAFMRHSGPCGRTSHTALISTIRSRMSRGGMKLPCTNPCRSKVASHRLSFGSVFLPRSASTCSGFAKMIFRLPSKILNTGFQYEPVLSITASVHFVSTSHARNRSNSFTVVPNRGTSATGFRFAGPSKTHTAKHFLPTSIPAQFSTLTSMLGLAVAGVCVPLLRNWQFDCPFLLRR